MEFTKEQIDSFIAAWQRAFDETLTESEAVYHAGRLMQFVLLMTEPLPSEQEECSRNTEI